MREDGLKPLLTDENIFEWEEERRKIEEEIAELQQRLRAISRKLSAAYIFYPERQQAVEPIEAPEARESIPSAVLRILTSSGTALSPAAIRGRLRNEGFDNPSIDGGYFYLMMKQLVRKGKLLEAGDGKGMALYSSTRK